MEFNYLKTGLDEDSADVLIISVFKNKQATGTVAFLDKKLDGHLGQHIKDEDFTGEEGKTLTIHTHGKLKYKKIALLGLGSSKDFSPERIRRAGGSCYSIAKKMKASNALVQLPFNRCFAGTMEGAHAMIEGLLLASYRFEKYKKTDKKIERLKRVGIVLPSGLNSSRMKKIEMVATAFAEGTLMARDLVNTPSQDMCPKHMVEQAEKISSSSARLKLKVFNSAELKKMKCGGILSVAQGSEQEPYMVHLTYKPLKKTSKKIVLVGKGVTFDSGGLSLKPAGSMEDMKIDMSGAAAVLGVFSTLTKLMPSVEVHGIAALVENMPSGSAIRPGDIVDTMSGKTIEILNTDAEGRVTLADALFYGSKLKPDVMIDIATLTGAVMVALGQDVAGLMSNNKRLTDKLLQASKITGEMMWELPLVPEYAKQVKSKFADVKNITGNRYGGSITAGLFLSEFVGDTKWAHLDIAGPAYAEKESLSYDTWGATGFPVRTLLRFIMKF